MIEPGTEVRVAATAAPREVRRHGDAPRARLQYAQVYEDPLLEIEALRPAPGRRLVVVSSGGCTALSLLAGGSRVIAIDSNATQNDLVELKLAAVTALSHRDALSFLGAREQEGSTRLRHYRDTLRPALGEGARAHWDAHPDAIRRGVLGAGAAERFGAIAASGIRLAIHPRARIERMLGSANLETQRARYHAEWDTARWRALFTLLFGRATFRGRFWGPDVRELARTGAFAEHFRRRFERALRDQPVRDNYFLHYMLLGRYPTDEPAGLPPYLSADARDRLVASRGALELVDATFTSYLATQPDASVDGFAISNILEWMPPSAVEPLFREIVRTAAPGASLCLRNLLGWTEIPDAFRHAIVARPGSDAMFDRDRSTIQRRFVACDVVGGRG